MPATINASITTTTGNYYLISGNYYAKCTCSGRELLEAVLTRSEHDAFKINSTSNRDTLRILL